MGSAVILALLATAPDFDAIVAGVSDRSHAESCAAMTAWAAENAGDVRARQGRVWCARLLLGDRELDAARKALEGVTGDDEIARQALSTLGEIDFGQGRYAAAAADYRPLAASPIELWRYTGTQALIEIERARKVWWQAAAGAAVLLAWLTWRGASLRRRLWPAPTEVVVLAPLLLLLSGVALTQPAEIARGLASLVAGGVAVAWINGAYWQANPPGSKRGVEALKGAAQGLLLLDVVLVSSGLWRALWQSMVGGFD